jgi:hypothetical protein
MEDLVIESNTLVFYIDDSGDERLSDRSHPIFALGGVACTTDFHVDVAREWQAMKSNIFPQLRGPLHAKTHLRDGKLLGAKREAVLAAVSNRALGRFGMIITCNTTIAEDRIMMVGCLNLANRLAHVAEGMANLGLWKPALPSRRAVAVFEHSARLANHIEHHFTDLALQVGGITVPIEGCFMPKSIANPFLEMADLVVNTVGRNVKYQMTHGRQACTPSFQRLFRDVRSPLANYLEITHAID